MGKALKEAIQLWQIGTSMQMELMLVWGAMVICVLLWNRKTIAGILGRFMLIQAGLIFIASVFFLGCFAYTGNGRINNFVMRSVYSGHDLIGGQYTPAAFNVAYQDIMPWVECYAVLPVMLIVAFLGVKIWHYEGKGGVKGIYVAAEVAFIIATGTMIPWHFSCSSIRLVDNMYKTGEVVADLAHIISNEPILLPSNLYTEALRGKVCLQPVLQMWDEEEHMVEKTNAQMQQEKVHWVLLPVNKVSDESLKRFNMSWGQEIDGYVLCYKE